MFSLIPKTWLLIIAAALFTAYTGWISGEVFFRTKNYYVKKHEAEIAKIVKDSKDALEKAQKENEDEIKQLEESLSHIKPVTDDNVKRMCQSDPNCKASGLQGRQ